MSKIEHVLENAIEWIELDVKNNYEIVSEDGYIDMVTGYRKSFDCNADYITASVKEVVTLAYLLVVNNIKITCEYDVKRSIIDKLNSITATDEEIRDMTNYILYTYYKWKDE